jgi:hypothetical protein
MSAFWAVLRSGAEEPCRLVVTGGRVRSESEFDELFETAGLVRARSVPTDGGYAILEAHAFNQTP